jgi:hypothetical protein
MELDDDTASAPYWDLPPSHRPAAPISRTLPIPIPARSKRSPLDHRLAEPRDDGNGYDNARGDDGNGYDNARGDDGNGYDNARGGDVRGGNARGGNARDGNGYSYGYDNARGGNARGGNARGGNVRGGGEGIAAVGVPAVAALSGDPYSEGLVFSRPGPKSESHGESAAKRSPGFRTRGGGDGAVSVNLAKPAGHLIRWASLEGLWAGGQVLFTPTPTNLLYNILPTNRPYWTLPT